MEQPSTLACITSSPIIDHASWILRGSHLHRLLLGGVDLPYIPILNSFDLIDGNMVGARTNSISNPIPFSKIVGLNLAQKETFYFLILI